ncbi:MAG: NAD(P)(+) transhydrogenase (Re/Si-specific) subunit beta [Firmicutes bacterium]|nr:NAD(P)(+) transhydrogenase (Re/Si-specific) subunit beta [Bacillota bacterium]
MASRDPLRNLITLAGSILFIFGIKGLTHPRTAVRGNLISAVAMLLAVLGTLAGAMAAFVSGLLLA